MLRLVSTQNVSEGQHRPVGHSLTTPALETRLFGVFPPFVPCHFEIKVKE